MKNLISLLFFLSTYTVAAQDFNVKSIGQQYDLKRTTPYYSYMSGLGDSEHIVIEKQELDEQDKRYRHAFIKLKNGKTSEKYLHLSGSNVRLKQKEKSEKYALFPNDQISLIKFDNDEDTLEYFNFEEKKIKSILSDSDYLVYDYENDKFVAYSRKYYSSGGGPMMSNGIMMGGRETRIYYINLLEDKKTGEYYYFETSNYGGIPNIGRNTRSKESLERLLSEYPNLKHMIPAGLEDTKFAITNILDIVHLKQEGNKLYLNEKWEIVKEDTTSYAYKLVTNKKSDIAISITVLDKKNHEIIKGNYLSLTGELKWNYFFWYDDNGIKTKSLLFNKDEYSGDVDEEYTEYNKEKEEIISYTVDKRGKVKFNKIVDKEKCVLNPKEKIDLYYYDKYLNEDLKLYFKRQRLKIAYYTDSLKNMVAIYPNAKEASWKKKSKLIKKLNEFLVEKGFENKNGKMTVFMRLMVNRTGVISSLSLIDYTHKLSELESLLQEFMVGKEFFKPATLERKSKKYLVNQLIIEPIIIK